MCEYPKYPQVIKELRNGERDKISEKHISFKIPFQLTFSRLLYALANNEEEERTRVDNLLFYECTKVIY